MTLCSIALRLLGGSGSQSRRDKQRSGFITSGSFNNTAVSMLSAVILHCANLFMSHRNLASCAV